MSAGDDIPLDAALIDAFRIGLEQGLNAGLSAAAAACMKARFPLRIVDADSEPKSFEEAAADYHAIATNIGCRGDAARVASFRREVERRREMEARSDPVVGFFDKAEKLATSRGFRRLSVRYSVRKGDDEICYEVDGDVNLSPEP